MLNTVKKIGLIAVVAFSFITSASASEDSGYEFKKYDWKHAGPFGTFDKAQLQRGLQVYREVCSACHSMNLVAIRTLSDLGYNQEEIKAIAAEYTFEDKLGDDGEYSERSGKPSDAFPAPFANVAAAKYANGGATPPDFSLIAKAREHLSMFRPWASLYGEDYIVGILTAYTDAPEGTEMSAGQNWNPAFPGSKIAMAPPLAEDHVEYADGTKATVEQMSQDVAAFLYWVSEPKMEER
jgi:ubiquinol-cytochrome c reductase cytochrome c1 subunit